MARSDKTHEQRIVDLEVELANVNNFISCWMKTGAYCDRISDKPAPRTFWQKLNAYLSR